MRKQAKKTFILWNTITQVMYHWSSTHSDHSKGNIEMLQFLLQMMAFDFKKSAIMYIFQCIHTHVSFKRHKIVASWITKSDNTFCRTSISVWAKSNEALAAFPPIHCFLLIKRHRPAKCLFTHAVLLSVIGLRHPFLRGPLNNPCSRWTTYVNTWLVCMFLYQY